MTERKWYPGTESNPFHKVLLGLAALDRLPWPLVGLLLAGAGALLYAALPAPGWPLATWALGVLFDGLLLAALPRFRRSFGPAIPPLILLAALRWMVAAALGWLAPSLGNGLTAGLSVAAQTTGIFLTFYGHWVEPQRLTVTHQQLISPKLPPGRTLRALHLGDIHMERWTARENRLLACVNALDPDVILFSGDLLNISHTHDPQAQADVVRLLNGLHAPLGVYAVTGSPAVDLPEVAADVYARTPHIRWLQNEAICLDGCNLAVLGVHCTQNPGIDGPQLEKVAAEATENRFRLLLYHTPDLAPEASAAGVDLQLSGHTHGGQVRLPGFGALFAGSLYGKRFEMGRYRVGEMTLYVTRGIGMEGLGIPRVRVLSPPEITLWALRGGE